MRLLARWRRWLNGQEPELPTTDELREAQELRTENRRHVDAIERHVNTVTARVRADAAAVDRRFIERRANPR